MSPTDPQSHEAPLVHLVTHVLHKGTTLADRVRHLRKKRRKPKVQVVEEVQL